MLGNETKVTTSAGAGALATVLISMLIAPLFEDWRGRPLSIEEVGGLTTVLIMAAGWILPGRKREPSLPLPPPADPERR